MKNPMKVGVRVYVEKFFTEEELLNDYLSRPEVKESIRLAMWATIYQHLTDIESLMDMFNTTFEEEWAKLLSKDEVRIDNIPTRIMRELAGADYFREGYYKTQKRLWEHLLQTKEAPRCVVCDRHFYLMWHKEYENVATWKHAPGDCSVNTGPFQFQNDLEPFSLTTKRGTGDSIEFYYEYIYRKMNEASIPYLKQGSGKKPGKLGNIGGL